MSHQEITLKSVWHSFIVHKYNIKENKDNGNQASLKNVKQNELKREPKVVIQPLSYHLFLQILSKKSSVKSFSNETRQLLMTATQFRDLLAELELEVNKVKIDGLIYYNGEKQEFEFGARSNDGSIVMNEKIKFSKVSDVIKKLLFVMSSKLVPNCFKYVSNAYSKIKILCDKPIVDFSLLFKLSPNIRMDEATPLDYMLLTRSDSIDTLMMIEATCDVRPKEAVKKSLVGAGFLRIDYQNSQMTTIKPKVNGNIVLCGFAKNQINGTFGFKITEYDDNEVVYDFDDEIHKGEDNDNGQSSSSIRTEDDNQGNVEQNNELSNNNNDQKDSASTSSARGRKPRTNLF